MPSPGAAPVVVSGSLRVDLSGRPWNIRAAATVANPALCLWIVLTLA